MRRRSRSCALQMLYQLELGKELGGEVAREPAVRSAIARFWHNFESLDAKDEQFAERLVLGVARNVRALDEALSRCSKNWRLSRMDKVDLSILRLAAYELLYCPDLPRAATLNEAIELGKLFSGHDSSAFINGVLDQLAVDKQEPAALAPSADAMPAVGRNDDRELGERPGAAEGEDLERLPARDSLAEDGRLAAGDQAGCP